MQIHEYQAKKIFRKFGVKVPEGKTTYNIPYTVQIAEELGNPPWILKAQVHAGGRGKGGGVKVAENMNALREYARDLLGMTLITHQTGPEGKKVNMILIEEVMDIEREIYLGMAIDRQSESIVMMASNESGMDIEKVASERSDAFHKEWIDPAFGFSSFQP